MSDKKKKTEESINTEEIQVQELEKEVIQSANWLVFEIIPKIMWEVWAVWKWERNKQQGFMYRSIDAVQNALNKSMAKYWLFIIPNVLDSKKIEKTSKNWWTLFYTILKIKYKIYAKDWSFVEAIMEGEAMDSWDKWTNKALSIALKYLLLEMFMIPTEESKDPDWETHEIKKTTSELYNEMKSKDIDMIDLVRIQLQDSDNLESLTEASKEVSKIKNNLSEQAIIYLQSLYFDKLNEIKWK